MSKSKMVNSVSDAIDALGGPRKIATYLGIDESPITLWRDRGFPARFSWALYDALEEAELEFDEKILGQRKPAVTWKEVVEGRAVYKGKKARKSKNGR